MSDPLTTPDDLAILLRDSAIDVDRATMMIEDAQSACEMIVNPVPAAAAWIVRKVAARGYVTTTSSKGAAGSPMGAQTSGLGGIWLMKAEERALRTYAGGGGVFSVDILPAGYVAPASWGTGSSYSTDWDQP